jgi:hypothetical protein
MGLMRPKRNFKDPVIQRKTSMHYKPLPSWERNITTPDFGVEEELTTHSCQNFTASRNHLGSQPDPSETAELPWV